MKPKVDSFKSPTADKTKYTDKKPKEETQITKIWNKMEHRTANLEK